MYMQFYVFFIGHQVRFPVNQRWISIECHEKVRFVAAAQLIVVFLFVGYKFGECSQLFVISHRIHVWYICLHLVDFYGKCR